MPRALRAYWEKKTARNVARDRHVTRALREEGWQVSRIWEDSVSETINPRRVAEGADTNGQKTVAEFFAGIGLMRMGLERAGWDVVWENDMDEDKMKVYRGHYADDDAHFHLGDVQAI